MSNDEPREMTYPELINHLCKAHDYPLLTEADGDGKKARSDLQLDTSNPWIEYYQTVGEPDEWIGKQRPGVVLAKCCYKPSQKKKKIGKENE